MTRKRIGLISNPGSTRMRKGMKAVRDAADRYPDLAHYELASIDDVTDALQEFSRQGIELVVINGGDGTVQAVITAIINQKPYDVPPAFAILPGGRTNMTAEALGGFRKPVQHLHDLMAIIARGEMPKTVPLPFVSMQLTPDHAPVYGTFFGTATVVRGMQFCRRRIYPLGLPNGLSHLIAVTYLSLVAASPFKSKQSPMRREPIAINFGTSAIEPRPYLLVLATTLDRLILGLSTSSGIGEGGLRFTSIDYTAGAVFRSLLALAFGRPSGKIVRGLSRRRVPTMNVMSECPVTLDGEMFDPEGGHPVSLKATAPFQFVQYDAV